MKESFFKRTASSGAVRLFLAAAAAALLGLSTAVIFTEIKIYHLVLGGLGESFSTRIYGAPVIINDQTRRSPLQLILRLDRLKYRETKAASIKVSRSRSAIPKSICSSSPEPIPPLPTAVSRYSPG